MRIYWSLKSIPELKGLAPETQQRLWRAAFKKVGLLWSLLLSFLVVIPIGAAFSYAAKALGESLDATFSTRLIILISGLLIGVTLGGGVYGQILTEIIRANLRKELKTSGV